MFRALIVGFDVDIGAGCSTNLFKKFLHPSLAVFCERPLAAGLGLFSLVDYALT